MIASGGDGFYVEVLHGILQQTQEKAAVDSNDPDASLVPPPVPIGLMPTGEERDVVACWLLNVPATCECISGTDLHRQFYVLPH